MKFFFFIYFGTLKTIYFGTFENYLCWNLGAILDFVSGFFCPAHLCNPDLGALLAFVSVGAEAVHVHLLGLRL